LALGLWKESRQPFNKVFTVCIIVEYLSTFYASDNNMMQEAGRI